MKILKKIKEILDAKLTNLEYLESKKRSEVSLGVIKPKIIDMIWEDVKEHKKIDNAKKQMTLDNKSALKIEKMDKRFRYVFKCSDSCQTTHKIMCEDWELGELYRKMRKKYDEEEACYTCVSNGLWRARNFCTKTEKGATVWFSDTQVVVKI